ncbi:GNAT family N-acetyltransferase [Pseudoruegeria sp. SK021]|uniref:GNAT family N-acetyltransferase n=1 Tax=Pseudoruegeria sp. SK021 TaxID=1933035 RepID=UPI000A25F31B|nr:GNAT family N-acetyltransferase [Pseudoruegeria sp. SK021]OSP55410.1 hypothetical protein BV911_08025 [Pseudoruegeria sp. SK021]
MIRTMTEADLTQVLNWAADEGWNPGMEDAPAFLAADPGGFLVGEQDGKLVSAISVVNHSPEQAFLGLYLVHPNYRGQGLGMAIWSAGLAQAGARSVGLDGVPAQQANYARSGFVRTGQTIRYAGLLQGEASQDVRPFTTNDLEPLLAADALACGVMRPAYLAAWLQGARHRETFVLDLPQRPLGFVTARDCRTGVKIGPLHAPDRASALRLLMACLPHDRAVDISLDIPADRKDMCALAEDLGLVPVFETARMYLGPAPVAAPPAYYAIATMELG